MRRTGLSATASCRYSAATAASAGLVVAASRSAAPLQRRIGPMEHTCRRWCSERGSCRPDGVANRPAPPTSRRTSRRSLRCTRTRRIARLACCYEAIYGAPGDRTVSLSARVCPDWTRWRWLSMQEAIRTPAGNRGHYALQLSWTARMVSAALYHITISVSPDVWSCGTVRTAGDAADARRRASGMLWSASGFALYVLSSSTSGPSNAYRCWFGFVEGWSREASIRPADGLSCWTSWR